MSRRHRPLEGGWNSRLQQFDPVAVQPPVEVGLGNPEDARRVGLVASGFLENLLDHASQDHPLEAEDVGAQLIAHVIG